MRRVLERIVLAFASFHLACTLFVMLLVVVLVGTLEQQHMSLYEVQRKYFSSLFFTTPVPFPGGALLLGLLFLNLTIGGLLRIRWKTATVGVIVVHVGILMLLVGGFVEYRYSQKGFIKLFEAESGDRFRSYDDWDVVIERADPDPKLERQWFVPAERVARATDGRTVRVTAPDLPFDVLLTGYARNADVRPARSSGAGIDGMELVSIASTTLDGEANIPAVVASVVAKGSGAGSARTRGYLLGSDRGYLTHRSGAYAWSAEFEGVSFHLALVRRSWPVPFETRLDRTIGEKHPGTGMFRRFSSFVTVNDGGVSRDVHITMNEPLRWKGMIFYQSGYEIDPERGPTSTFAVVYNPSDRVPIIACSVIGIGMMIHFGLRLLRYLDAESKLRLRRALEASEAAVPAGSTS